MLHSPVPLERRCPRPWSLAAACGLLSAAVLTAGFTLKAAAEPPKDEPKKDEPTKVEPKAEQPAAVPDLPGSALDALLKNLPADLDAEQFKALHAQIEQMRAQMRKAMDLQRQNGLGAGAAAAFNGPFGNGLLQGLPGPAPQDVRLGVSVERPGDTLAEQLELPKNQGLVIRDVTADSAAAKAGLKTHDILLELDGKSVSSDPVEFRKTVAGVKADTPVDAVVLRKGRKETVKGLSLPEVKAAAPGLPGFNPLLPGVPGVAPGLPNLPLFPGGLPGVPINVPAVGGVGLANNGGNGVMTTMFRTNDHFTTRHQEGSLVITLTGKVADGKATVNEITVQDGAESHSYDRVDKAPEKYRDKIKNLVEMSEKGGVKVEVNNP